MSVSIDSYAMLEGSLPEDYFIDPSADFVRTETDVKSFQLQSWQQPQRVAACLTRFLTGLRKEYASGFV